MTDYYSFSSIPPYNRFRYTANTVDRDDLIALAVKMPRGFRLWFMGAFSVMLDIDGWASANGVSPETMVEIANNDVMFSEFCEFVADCIMNSEDVQNALASQSASGGNARTVINNTVYSNTVIIAENADANGCTDDARYGRIEALIDYINTVQEDFYQSVDAATNVLGELSTLVSAIPLFETLPFDELIATIADTGEQWDDSYIASYNTQLKEDFICELWCGIQGCDVTLEDVRIAIESRYNLDSTQGALNVLSLVALFGRIATTVGSAGGLTYIGDDFVFLSWLLQIAAVEATGQFFGVSIGDYVGEASNGSPSGLWSGCTPCPQVWQEVFDFTVSDGGFQAQGSDQALYQPGVGWAADLGNPLTNHLIRIFRTFATTQITRIEFTIDTQMTGNRDLAAIQTELSGVATSVFTSQPTSATSFDTGAISQNSDQINLDISENFSPVSTTVVITGCTVEGTGTNPF